MNEQTLFRAVGTSERLVDRVVDEIERLILDGSLQPGVRLPPEREFAEQLGVSRTVVREAVHILVAKGLLETRHGVGTIVRQVGGAQVVEQLGLLLQTRGMSLDHLFQVRIILEVEIAGLAASHVKEKDIAELESILENMRAVNDDPDAFAQGDIDFHRYLCNITGNPFFGMLLDSIRGMLQLIRLSTSRNLALHESVLVDLRLILDCVANGDVPGARESMRTHLESGRRDLEEILAR